MGSYYVLNVVNCILKPLNDWSQWIVAIFQSAVAFRFVVGYGRPSDFDSNCCQRTMLDYVDAGGDDGGDDVVVNFGVGGGVNEIGCGDYCGGYDYEEGGVHCRGVDIE